jgi:1-acyl-sn-glycerol-3-phosphate acyltransferase
MVILSVLAAAGACIGGNAGLHSLWIAPLSFVGSFLGLLILVFLVILVAALCVDQKKPQEEDNWFYRTLVTNAAEMALTVARVRIHTRGLEQAPQTGRFVLVCNHIHDFDPAILLKNFPKSQLAFIGKQEVREMFLVGPLMHKFLCQFINRENDREALKTILTCIKIIQEDKASIAVFPEGYIKPDRKLHHFRHGVFKIALKTKVPIVICTLQNTNKIFKNALRLKPTDVHLHLVDVLYPESFEGKTAVQVGEEVHRLMAEDLGPDLVLPEA